MSVATKREALVQLSPRGQVTLPIEIRKALGVEAGDAMLVSVEAGRIVLSLAVVTPVERYNEEQIAEFEQAAQMTGEQVETARKKWDL